VAGRGGGPPQNQRFRLLFPLFLNRSACLNPPLSPVIAAANTCGTRRCRARALGRRGGGHGELPVYRAPPLPELLLLRRRRHRRGRCVPVPMVRQFQPTESDPHPCALGMSDCSACSYDAPVGTDVLSLLHKDCRTSRLSTHQLGQTGRIY
jgi:hypothetical protein